MSDQQYLLSNQYNDSVRLNARIQLHERFSTNPRNLQHWIFEQLVIPAPYNILELGSGPGPLWSKNLVYIPIEWQITLSDFSEGMLEDTRRNLGTERFHYAVVDAQSIPFADNTFDAVIANHMLYHVPDLARAFAEVRRVLTLNGHFYAVTNGSEHLREIKQFCERAGIVLNGVLGSAGAISFSLQNGTEQLAPWFPHVELRRMENNLSVTEAEPLLAFILSCFAPGSITADQLDTLRTMIDQELAQHGSIHITKETGLFIAS
ncbi:hypothetical protein KDW_59180 [Dictyobacter vulcani]|uniref:Methyltransferase type 11 domain-containing protein n=1 Tax=Dictyobacter vulcani TaxID=2607529 RepID=A0A5J4L2Q9_9CHLR|nr:class I SAM-dependent methyltransferase [Dictyobacter vulcani]GER91756.1 hypothetical protein KDW_59180 [Dictyobacter vulcani]